jgi:hypothetical protein
LCKTAGAHQRPTGSQARSRNRFCCRTASSPSRYPHTRRVNTSRSISHSATRAPVVSLPYVYTHDHYDNIPTYLVNVSAPQHRWTSAPAPTCLPFRGLGRTDGLAREHFATQGDVDTDLVSLAQAGLS